MKILIVEDDSHLAAALKSGLSVMNTVEVASDGAEGSFLARSYDYDVIILDYSLPKKDGLIVLTEIRQSGKNMPIIFLSATDEVETKIAALEKGADDYMTKPFSMTELQARLKALTRRPPNISSSVVKIADIILNNDNQTVERRGSRITLTRKEFNVLEYLMRHAGKVLSRTQILEHVWTAENDPFSNTVEAHIRNVRLKLNKGKLPNLIANIPGRGYLIDSAENLARHR